MSQEDAFIERLASRPRARRYGAYLMRGGPGYLQSAMTLGGGTALSALYAGKMFGHQLLWVAPAGMLIGICMLGVLARLTLTTDPSSGERPYAAMARHAGRGVAMAWALGTIIASIVWHFPQYALAGSAIEDLGLVAERTIHPGVGALGVLAAALTMSLLYGRSPRLVRAYETVVKVLVIGMIACFAAVVMRVSGQLDWGSVLAGFIPSVPAPQGGISSTTLIAAGLSSAVGINMVFLYPYSLRARNWGQGHVEFARVDLVAGMLVPYTIAASLVAIAAAATIPWVAGEDPTKMAPVEAARAFGDVLGPTAGRLVFDLGLVGMALSTIALHMLACGFAVAEITGAGPKSRAYRIGTLLPIPGVLGPFVWKKLMWISLPTSIVCGLFLPVAYVGIILWARARGGRKVPLLLAALTALFTAVLLAHLAAKVGIDLGGGPQ